MRASIAPGAFPETLPADFFFTKDGYTDLRGRFDYSSLSTSDPDQVERFALLVLSDAHGAGVQEAAAPKR